MYWFANGDVYEGHWINGKRHGQGWFQTTCTFQGFSVNDPSMRTAGVVQWISLFEVRCLKNENPSIYY